MATTHVFAVPDKAHARALADALGGCGFPLVTARPLAGRRPFDPELETWWGVTAFDDGRYAPVAEGYQQREAVRRAAQAVARAHRGFWSGGGALEWFERLAERFAPIVRTNRGAQPTVPPLTAVQAPEPAMLPVDDRRCVPGGRAELTGLDEVQWASLFHAHGTAEDVPLILRFVCEDDQQWDNAMDELLYDNVLHQGSCYPATAPTMRFLARLMTAGTLPAPRRLRLCADLLNAAGQVAASTVLLADRNVAFGRAPSGAPWTEEVNATVGECAPDLLARWPVEPPATRLVLAALAALFPEPGRAVGEQILTMRVDHAGTQPGAYLDLASMLLTGRDGDALAAARAIADWDDLEDVDTPAVQPGVRAASILAEGIVRRAFQTLRQAG